MSTPSPRHPCAARRRNAAALLAALLVCSCAAEKPAAPAEERGGAAESVTLRFAWPDGLRADVRSTAVKAQTLGPQSRTQDLTATYVMAATHVERGVSVAFDEFRVVHSGDDPAAGNPVEKLLAYRPGFLLDESGQLLEIQGLETLRELLQPLQERLETASDQERAGLQAVLQTVTSEQYLKSRAGAEWSNLIGSWLNETYEVGQVVTLQEETPPAGVLETPVPTETRITLSRIDSCSRSGATGCVRLRLTKEPDPDRLREAMLPNLNQMLGVEDWGPDGPPLLESVVATSQLIVDTEPDTLVPHRVEALRVLTMDLERPDGPIQVRDSNRTTSTYTYP